MTSNLGFIVVGVVVVLHRSELAVFGCVCVHLHREGVHRKVWSEAHPFGTVFVKQFGDKKRDKRTDDDDDAHHHYHNGDGGFGFQLEPPLVFGGVRAQSRCAGDRRGRSAARFSSEHGRVVGKW